VKPAPLSATTLNGIRRVAVNWAGEAAADDVVNEVHRAYLAGEVAKDKLLMMAKRQGIDAHRAERAGKLREARAAEGRAEVIGHTTTEADEHADHKLGARVQEVVDLDATQTAAGGPSIDPTALALTFLAPGPRAPGVWVRAGTGASTGRSRVRPQVAQARRPVGAERHHRRRARSLNHASSDRRVPQRLQPEVYLHLLPGFGN